MPKESQHLYRLHNGLQEICLDLSQLPASVAPLMLGQLRELWGENIQVLTNTPPLPCLQALVLPKQAFKDALASDNWHAPNAIVLPLLDTYCSISGPTATMLCCFDPGSQTSFLPALYRAIWRFSFTLGLEQGALLVHAGAVGTPERGVLILGASGAGKSTLVANHKQQERLSDEAIWIIKEESSYYLRPSLWHIGRGDPALCTRASVPFVEALYLRRNVPLGQTEKPLPEALHMLMHHQLPDIRLFSPQQRASAFAIAADALTRARIWNLSSSKDHRVTLTGASERTGASPS